MALENSVRSQCSKCGGTGWLIVEVEDGREAARRCECSTISQIDRLIDDASIPKHYRELNLENFDTYHPVLRAAKKIVEEFLDSYPAAEKGLLLAGPPGTGKTHLAAALLIAAIRKCRIKGLFCDYRELIRSIQNSYNPGTETTEMSIIRPVLEAELLVMDELGALRPTEWVQDTITYIINNRYSNDRITIFTSNYPIQAVASDEFQFEKDKALRTHLSNLENELPTQEFVARRKKILERYIAEIDRYHGLQDRVGVRLMSRLYEMCRFVPLDGVPDYRKRSIDARSRIRTKPS